MFCLDSLCSKAKRLRSLVQSLLRDLLSERKIRLQFALRLALSHTQNRPYFILLNNLHCLICESGPSKGLGIKRSFWVRNTDALPQCKCPYIFYILGNVPSIGIQSTLFSGGVLSTCSDQLMMFAIRLGGSTHLMMLNPTCFALAGNKSNILTKRKEC